MKSKNWNPVFDAGRHHRACVGLILMSTDLACESDSFAMVPSGVGLHITRLRTDDHTTHETLSQHVLQMSDAAARLQPDLQPAVISYSCTSGSIVIGEEKIYSEILRGAPYTQPMCIARGVVDALRAVDARKIVVGTPYLDEINVLEKQFLTQHGFDVLHIEGLNLKTGIEFGRITPEFLLQFATAIDRPDCDALFLSCSGIRATEIVEKLEAKIGKPVITSNQAQLWACLRLAGIADTINGFGTLFSLPLKARP